MDYGEPPAADNVWIVLFLATALVTITTLRFGLFDRRQGAVRLGAQGNIIALVLTVGLMILAYNSESRREQHVKLSKWIGIVNLVCLAINGLGAFTEGKLNEESREEDREGFRCLQCGSPVPKKDQSCPACGWTWKGPREAPGVF